MEVEKPAHLTIVKTIDRGITVQEVYAADPNGDVWKTYIHNGIPGNWKLYKRASELTPAPISFDQAVQQGLAQDNS